MRLPSATLALALLGIFPDGILAARSLAQRPLMLNHRSKAGAATSILVKGNGNIVLAPSSAVLTLTICDSSTSVSNATDAIEATCLDVKRLVKNHFPGADNEWDKICGHTPIVTEKYPYIVPHEDNDSLGSIDPTEVLEAKVSYKVRLSPLKNFGLFLNEMRKHRGVEVRQIQWRARDDEAKKAMRDLRGQSMTACHEAADAYLDFWESVSLQVSSSELVFESVEEQWFSGELGEQTDWYYGDRDVIEVPEIAMGMEAECRFRVQ